MGQETTQPTPIDAEEYERFKSFVNDIHGQIRGNLKREIENALREYRNSHYGDDQLTRIEDDVATLKAMMAEGEADGGTAPQTVSEGEDTRARGSGKPAPNQPRQDKVEYLVAEVLDLNSTLSRESGQVAPKKIRQIIESKYNFKEDTVDEYIRLIISELGAERHPRHGKTYLWGDAYDDAIDELRNDADRKVSGVSK